MFTAPFLDGESDCYTEINGSLTLERIAFNRVLYPAALKKL